MQSSFLYFLAIFIAYAIAWLLSKAGIIPSTFVSILKASIASSSVIASYITLLIDLKYACSGPIPG